MCSILRDRQGKLPPGRWRKHAETWRKRRPNKRLRMKRSKLAWRMYPLLLIDHFFKESPLLKYLKKAEAA